MDVTAGRDGTYTFEQPKGRVTITVTFVRTGGAVSDRFSDVPGTYWAYNEIRWAYDNGYVNGTGADTFAPGASTSRQQVWMILARLSGRLSRRHGGGPGVGHGHQRHLRRHRPRRAR